MFNPLLPDLSKVKNEEIDNKINELMRKFFIAARSGQGALCEQISVLLETYKEEQRRRHYEENKRLLGQNKNLDDYINVDS